MAVSDKWLEELAYCYQLIERGGTEDVPRDSIAGYLHCQQVGATRENEPLPAEAFRLARFDCIEQSAAALRTLSRAIAVRQARQC